MADSNNGLVLDGTFLPETVLEILLSYCSSDSILNVRQVCKLWRDITTRRSYWKEVCMNSGNGAGWRSVPEGVKERDNAWMVFYSLVRHSLLKRNLIRNPSGEEQFSHWDTLHDTTRYGQYGHRMIIESPPAGIVYEGVDESLVQSAFVTSYGWGTIQQRIDLWELGLTPEIMRRMLPFQFVCSVMIAPRFDCGGITCTCLCLQDSENKTVTYSIADAVHGVNSGWTEYTYTLSLLPDADVDPRNFRYLLVILSGKDDRFWAGQYGPKFSRVTVLPKFLTLAEGEDPPKNQQKVEHRDLVSYFSYDAVWRRILNLSNESNVSEEEEDFDDYEELSENSDAEGEAGEDEDEVVPEPV